MKFQVLSSNQGFDTNIKCTLANNLIGKSLRLIAQMFAFNRKNCCVNSPRFLRLYPILLQLNAKNYRLYVYRSNN